MPLGLHVCGGDAVSWRGDGKVAELTAGLEVHDGREPGRHGAIPTRTYRREDVSQSRTLVWLHGGAFSHGNLDAPESYAVAAALAHQGLTVITVDYRRVPQWSWMRDSPPGELPGVRFPVPVEDIMDVYAAIAARIPEAMLGGASAAACLAAGATLRFVHGGGPIPPQLALAYGTFHARLPDVSPDIRSRIRGRHALMQFRPTTVRRMNHNYAGSTAAMRSPYAFPGGHELKGMPPTIVIDADRDSLRASGEKFATELTEAGADTTYCVVEGSTHGFLNRPDSPAFHQGIRLLAAQLQNH